MIDIIQLVLTWITCLALIATLIFVVKYTIQTKKLAGFTAKEFKKRISPVVCAYIGLPELPKKYEHGLPINHCSEDGYDILVKVKNTSDNHALASVKIEFEFAGETMKPQADVYREGKEIFVPAKETFHGNFSFDETFKGLSKNKKEILDDRIEGSKSDAAFGFGLLCSDKYIEFDLDRRTGVKLSELLLSDSGLKIRFDVQYRRWPAAEDDEIHKLPQQIYTMRIKRNLPLWRLTCIPDGTVPS